MPDYGKFKSEVIAMGAIVKEFPESIQATVFKVLLDAYLGKEVSVPVLDSVNVTSGDERVRQSERISGRKRRSATTVRESYEIVKDLNLGSEDSRQSFKEFCKEKTPRSNIQFNVVAVYYLKKVIGVPKVSLAHIYTCYKDVSRKLGNLKQSVLDASSNKYGYLDAGDLDDIKIPTRGESFVEHDLPKRKG